MSIRVCVAWVLFALGVGGHMLRLASDSESTYHVAVACFFMLSAIWARKP